MSTAWEKHEDFIEKERQRNLSMIQKAPFWWSMTLAITFWLIVILILAAHSFGETLTIDRSGCYNVTEGYNLCEAAARSGSKHLTLTCNIRHATCAPLDPGDYTFKVIRGVPYCKLAESYGAVCIEIQARPYNAIYIRWEGIR